MQGQFKVKLADFYFCALGTNRLSKELCATQNVLKNQLQVQQGERLDSLGLTHVDCRIDLVMCAGLVCVCVCVLGGVSVYKPPTSSAQYTSTRTRPLRLLSKIKSWLPI